MTVVIPTGARVIDIDLDTSETNIFKNVPYNTNEMFYSTDIGMAFLKFTGATQDYTGCTARLTLINFNDGSKVQRIFEMDTVTTFVYPMLETELAHAGRWIGQLAVIKNGTTISDNPFRFKIDGTILTTALISFDNINTFTSQLTTIYDGLNTFLDVVILDESERTDAEGLRVVAEGLRVTADALRETKEGTRQTTFEANEITRTGIVNSLVTAETIAQKVAEKYQLIEAESASRLLSVEQQLAQNANVQNTSGINIKYPFGTGLTHCQGDDITDDTQAIRDIFAYAYANNIRVIVPPGTYKVTSPIVVDHDLTKKPSLHIVGTGNTFTTKDKQNTSLFKGYNIPAKRGVLEFTGRGVNQATGVTLEYIGIDHDYASCDALAFDMVIGDANVPTVKKCTFSGFNNVMLRCGTAIDKTGYIFSNALFSQCFFITNRYVDWDGITILSKAQYGFAVVAEHIFNTGAAKLANIWDNVTFDECNFLGSVWQYGNVLYRNCMWEIPGAYKPEISISGSTVFDTAFLPDLVVDCGIGIAVLGGRANFTNPYFEDVRKCIATVKTGNSASKYLYVDNPTANATLNRLPTIGGVPQYSKYFIKTIGTNYTVPLIQVLRGSYAVGNYSQGYEEGVIINNVGAKMVVENMSNVTEDLIIDNYSRFKHYEGLLPSQNEGRTIEMNVTGTIPSAEYAYGTLLTIDDFATYREIPAHAIIKEISMIVPNAVTTGKIGLVTFTGAVAPTYSTLAERLSQQLDIVNAYCVKETIGAYTKYTFKSLPEYTVEQDLRKWYVKKGRKVAFYAILPSGLTGDTVVKMRVKLIV